MFNIASNQSEIIIIGTILYWFFVWGIFNAYLIPKKKFDYIKTPKIVGNFFAICSIIPLFIILNILPIYLIFLFFSSLLVLTTIFIVYSQGNKKQYGELLISKGMDVTFQQLIILLLFTELKKIGIDSLTTLTLIFLSIHIPLFFIPRLRVKTRIIFFLAIILGGWIFAYVYRNFGIYGLGLNQLIHLNFYVLYWKFFRKFTNMGVITFENTSKVKNPESTQI